jgi:hypothetical protein
VNSINLLFLFYFRKLVSRTDCLSTNLSTEEMTVTPDIPIPNIDVSPVFNPVEAVYYNNKISHPIVEAPDRSTLVTPQTGFHFLFSTEQTVDLTDSDNLMKK